MAVGVFVTIASNPMAVTTSQEQVQAAALAMTPVKPMPLAATVTLSSRTWGTRIDVHCTSTEGPGASSTTVATTGWRWSRSDATVAGFSWQRGQRNPGCRRR